MSCRSTERATDRCPLCGSVSRPAFDTTDRNRRVSPETFRYRSCQGCHVRFLSNPPSDLTRFYTSDYHLVPGPSNLDAVSAREAYKVDILREHVTEGRVVDVGPSFGGFPYRAHRAGYDVTAIETDPECCAFIESVVGVRAINSDEPEVALAAMADLDAVTLWHSIEHLPQPWRTIEAAVTALRRGGALVVATPNPTGIEARLLRHRWVHVDAPRHLFLISPTALAARAAAIGLTLADTTAADEEARRCNVLGWHHALRDIGFRGPPTPRLAEAIERALRFAEARPTMGSTYTSVFIKD